jgi:hypothetical protein
MFVTAAVCDELRPAIFGVLLLTMIHLPPLLLLLLLLLVDPPPGPPRQA